MDNNKHLTSGFYMNHPSVILLYYIGLISYAFIYTNPVFLLTFLAASLSLAAFYGGTRKLVTSLRGFSLFAAAIIIINPLVNHRGAGVLFYLFNRPVTIEAFLYGILSSLNILGLFLAFQSFNILIDSEKFLFLFGKIAPKTAFITGLSLRLNQLFIMRARTMMEVWETRALSVKSGSIAQKIKNSGLLMTALTVWSLEEGMAISEYMKAKGYGKAARTSFQGYMLTACDLFSFLFMSPLLIFSYIAAYRGIGGYSLYPMLKAVEFGPKTARAYMVMALFLMFPLFVELWVYTERRYING